MFDKSAQKTRAIALRKQGSSYSEILEKVPVAKSTLSLWLHSVGLSALQQQRLTKKRISSALRGAAVRHRQRVQSTEDIFRKSKEEIGHLSDRELFLIGVALYWAEGSKQKPHAVSARVVFSNSDPAMIVLFMKWLQLLCISPDRITIELYVHETAQERVLEIQRFWSKTLKSSINKFSHVYLKKGNEKTNRRNIGREYHGLVRIKVSESTDLNRQISGWVLGICQN